MSKELRHMLEEHFLREHNKEKREVGVEIELALMPIAAGEVRLEFLQPFVAWLETIGFIAMNRTNQGHICELRNEAGDTISFETTWNTIEFSMSKAVSLLEIYRRFYEMFYPIEDYCMAHGYFICGRGIHPNYETMNTAPLYTDLLLAKSEFLKNHTSHGNGEIFHALCISTQTHLESRSNDTYFRLLHFLRQVYALEPVLFANSSPPKAAYLDMHPAIKDLNRNTICYRDELWRGCEAPNVIQDGTCIKGPDEFYEYLKVKKLFILPEGDTFRAIAPISIEELYKGDDFQPEYLDYLRVLEPIAPTQRKTVEVRGTCTQTLDKLFVPSAFYVGLQANLSSGEQQVFNIYQKYFKGMKPLALRKLLADSRNQTVRESIHGDMDMLVDIAQEGLKRRGYGEEFLLDLLKEQYITDQMGHKKSVAKEYEWVKTYVQQQEGMK
ncbi:MAG: hypothetical protein R3Y67_08560 [Eubacteriales bacterium]